ncbi:MAG: flagellar hook-basal body complex protein FliE [Treponema sp.]|nr:flagellar hook-basal body complex protein FliE [Treponema sp.]
MNMKIPEFTSLQMVRTDSNHFGNSSLTKVTDLNITKDNANLLHTTEKSGTKSFSEYLMDAVNAVNDNQLDVNKVQEKLITNPEDVDIHDVTIAMSKARMSLNLAQTVIDRLVTDWNEITTTR